MTRTRILVAAATVAVCSILLVAASASFRGARHESPPMVAQDHQEHTQKSVSQDELSQNDFATRWTSRGKGDRLPLSASLPLSAPLPLAAAEAQPDAPVPPVAAKPEQPLQLATDDDLKQAQEEHHRHRDICARGRTWFTMNNHRYWRCKL